MKKPSSVAKTLTVESAPPLTENAQGEKEGPNCMPEVVAEAADPAGGACAVGAVASGPCRGQTQVWQPWKYTKEMG